MERFNLYILKMEIPSYIISVFAFLVTRNFVFAQTSSDSCILDTGNSISRNKSFSEMNNWGGFIKNKTCFAAFDDYLYALGRQANSTGSIYLDSMQQQNCLKSMKNVASCGIERLTKGTGGCSDYTVSDTANNLGVKFRNFQDVCKNLASESVKDRSCTACFTRWDEVESDVCRFAELVSMISSRIDDESWINSVFLCLGEYPLSEEQKDSIMEDTDTRSSSNNVATTRTGYLLLIVGFIGILVIIVISTWILCIKRKEEGLPTSEKHDFNNVTVSDDSFSENTSSSSSSLKISVKEVYSATNNLNPSNFIGQGIAGKVYRGLLSDGQHVAVKHIVNDGHIDTFVREVRSLSHVRHPNLVALLGYCEDRDDCFLVYELCDNGNLSQWLYGKDKLLSWTQRLEIAIDSARGLWFLHTYPEGCIVHRDIKPTNILISANFQAKLSDFGLSKVMDIGQSYVSSEVRGTFGYVDPEYKKNRRVNASGDVYSFGIVLLQLLSGQRVLDMNLNKPLPISKMARNLTRGGGVAEFADPKLNGDYTEEAFELVLKLALSCTGLKQERPSMEQVVLRLEKALEISSRSSRAHNIFPRIKHHLAYD